VRPTRNRTPGRARSVRQTTTHRDRTISDEGRRYTENEFALILRKAFELQERQGGGELADPADGLSLEEIRSVAAEVGLDPALVERAAAVLPATDTSALTRFFGGPSTYQMEYTVAGELSKEDLGRVVDAVRRATGHHGKVEEVLGSFDWQTVGELNQIHVTVSPREGQTSLRVIGDRGPAAGLTFLLPGLAGLVSIGIVGAIIEPTTVAGVAGVIAGCLSGGFLTGRTLWVATTKSFRRKLRDLMSAASRAVDDCVEGPARRSEPEDDAEFRGGS
jgi:hypothetical protein